MGYHTEFRGALRFNKKLNARQLTSIKQILGQDCRAHPEWGVKDLTFIDLTLTADNSGIVWDGSENTYHMPELVNAVITQMRRLYPNFGLSGAMAAQGDNVGDCWELYISEDGYAKRRDFVFKGEMITCPNCSTFMKMLC